MKFKLLVLLAFVGICASSLTIAENANRMLADSSNTNSQPALNLADNTDNSQTGSSTDNSAGNSDNSAATDNSGSSQDSVPPNNDDTSTDTGTGDDDY